METDQKAICSGCLGSHQYCNNKNNKRKNKQKNFLNLYIKKNIYNILTSVTGGYVGTKRPITVGKYTDQKALSVCL